MLLIRRFEESCRDLRREEHIAGSIHLCAGQEAVAVGACAVLDERDRVVATYRGHGWALACRVPVDGLMAEICQRATGVNGGRGGSPYLLSPDHGFLGENSIVGAGVPIAAGAALAGQHAGDGRVVVVSIGDGATSQGATHEGLVFARSRRLPLVVVCENNGWSELTPFARIAGRVSLTDRVAALDIPAAAVDGNDPFAVAAAVETAVRRARAGEGPSFVEAHCHRLWGHYNGDVEHYRPAADREAAQSADPLAALRAVLVERGHSAADLDAAEAEVESVVQAAAARAVAAPPPGPGTAHDHVVGTPAPAAPTEEPEQVRELTYIRAVNEALRAELAARPGVLVYGEDVGGAGGIFGATRSLQRDFGEDRVFDTPIAEAAILGSAVGAATEGLRPVVEVMWADFLLVALDQLVNQAANVRYLSRGTRSAPLVVRTQQGATPGACAQHAQSLEALLAHIPGLRVGLPSTPQDAYAMLRAAVADDDPCVIIEARGLYQLTGSVALGGTREGVGGARLRTEGDDLAIVTWGTAAPLSVTAAESLADRGIGATVVDLRWLAPLDVQTLDEVASRTGRVLVVHEANVTGGFGAEIAARVSATHFGALLAPVVRLGAADVRMPSAPALQEAILPSAEAIATAATALLSRK
jgi:2-oxoisovalerate dehydrogenase E1 component